MNFQKYIDLAYALYDPNFELRSQHVSIIIYKNKIVSIAKNNKKTSPKNVLNPKYSRSGENISNIKGCCSEFRALNQLKNKTQIPYNKITLINIRINRNMELCNSLLCDSCQSLIAFLGVKNVYYTDKQGTFAKYIN